MKSKYSHVGIFFLAFTPTLLISLYPIFFNASYWGHNDFDYNFFQLSVAYDSIFKFGEAPLWNPYDQGGSPLLATAYSRALNPYLFLYSIFDYLTALKFEILLHITAGAYGSFIYLRKHIRDDFASLFGSFLFAFSSAHILQAAQGQYELMCFLYVPYLFYFKDFQNIKVDILGYGLCLALMFFWGGVYSIVVSQTILVPLIFLESVIGSQKKKMAFLGLSLVLFFCLSAVKLLPTLSYMLDYPRQIQEFSGFSAWGLLHSLVNPDQRIFLSTDPGVFYDSLFIYNGLSESKGPFEGIDLGWDENGMFMGIIPLVISILGLIRCLLGGNFQWISIIFVLLSVWISLGERPDVSIWSLMHELPVYNGMRHATRFRFMTLFFLCTYFSIGLKLLWNTKKFIRIIRTSLAILLTLSLFQILQVVRDIASEAFVIPPFDEIKQEESFAHINYWRKYPYYNYTDHEGFYPAYLENKGVLHNKENQSLAIGALSYTSPHYKSEIFVTKGKSGAEVEILSRTHNSLVFRANGAREVTVNMNYHRGWSCQGHCKVERGEDNRIKIALKSDGQFKIKYTPLSFYVGLLLSILSFATLFFLGCHRSQPSQRWIRLRSLFK